MFVFIFVANQKEMIDIARISVIHPSLPATAFTAKTQIRNPRILFSRCAGYCLDTVSGYIRYKK